MDSCASENLLLVPQNIVFQIRDDSEKLCVRLYVRFGGIELNGTGLNF